MKLGRKLKGFWLGLIGTLYAFTPLMADDTEIFFGGSTSLTVRPNVLFILDTSKSMKNAPSGDTTGETKLIQMQKALRTILGSVQDVNVGFMRMNGVGGPILYPVSDIDKAVDAPDSQASGTLSVRVARYDHDAEELMDGTVVLDAEDLALSDRQTQEFTGVTDTFTLNGGDNDAFQPKNGSVNVTSNTIKLSRSGTGGNSVKYDVGVRFAQVEIPQGAEIQNAEVVFTIQNKKTNTLDLDIYAEDSSYPAVFSNSAPIASRTKTSAKVNWNSVASPGGGKLLTTPDVSSLVQEVVDRSDWEPGNNLAVLINQDGNDKAFRLIKSYNKSASQAPKLNVEYDYTVPAVSSKMVAIRFENLAIPQGARITSANLNLTAAEDTDNVSAILVQAESSDNSSELISTAGSLSSRSKTAGINWYTTTWAGGSTYQSPDLASVIEDVTDRSGWCGGNSLTLLLSGAGERLFRSFDGSSTEAASLDITYDVDSVADDACNLSNFEVGINHPDDDAEESASGTLYLNDNDLELVNDDAGVGSQLVGLRFNNLQLKQDASVESAYLEFAVDTSDFINPTSLTIKVESAENATPFSNDDKISTRNTFSESVTWNISDKWNTEHSWQRSPDISGLLEKVISQSKWEPGNSIVFTISGSGKRVAESYDGSVLAPRLVFQADPKDVIGDYTVRDEMIRLVDEMQLTFATPIVDNLYEAALYYRGETVDFGTYRGVWGSKNDNQNSRISHAESYTGGTVEQPDGCTDSNLSSNDCKAEKITGSPVYTSPITESCQQNYIVLLTDGFAYGNAAADKAKTMMGYTDTQSCAYTSTKRGKNDGECGEELADFLSSSDQLGALANDQTVKTYTVGFDLDDPWLKSVAVNGQGAYFTAGNSAALVDAFDQILKSISAIDTTYVEPSVTVNQFNRFSHRDDIYYSLFKPQETAKWLGNLKKYRLAGNPARVVDDEGNPAIDEARGFFRSTARSEWSVDEDGNKVELGGAAYKLPEPSARKIYTYFGGYPVADDTSAQLSGYPLTTDNNAITHELLDIVGQDASYRSNLMDWARGLQSDGSTARRQMGDPLHSRPVLMTYAVDSATKEPDSTVFIGTNEGYIHAIDTETGIEEFAFIPKELLQNLDVYYSNQTVSPRPYGMDGPISLWSRDGNNDGDYLDTADDFVYLYAGMRRGGRSYYALNVTDRTKPEMLWQINGGESGSDFEELGQTWSEPQRITVKFDDEVKDVLLFAGGYDPNQDNASVRTSDTVGRAIYMVDAKTGELFWKAGDGNGYDLGLSQMDYSIPSDITALDMNGDGLVDQFYVGDMGGQLWRFDIDQSNVKLKNKLVSGGVIADFSGSTKVSNRRFYYAPDISLGVDQSNHFMAIGIGSGYRAHPLNEEIEDRFYLLKQFDYIYSAPSSYSALAESDLYDATLNLIMEGTDAEKETAEVALSGSDSSRKDGWYIRLENTGEKVLAPSLTLNNQILFTTYQPAVADASSCNVTNGKSRIYIVGVADATPRGDLDEDGNYNRHDRTIDLKHGNIPSQPVVVDTIDSPPVVMVGAEPITGIDTGKQVIRTYWYEDTLE
ncbi:PilC/PilY family type IV pilus protein [Amphritea sp. HPY]|uniref:PilC/PilY family type IV pilus protein n=1 Tax=Amphritea sp. HPY TaxID=3421652 RepID=UPI003D7C6044